MIASFWITKTAFPSPLTLPKTNRSPLKMMVSNRNLLSRGLHPWKLTWHWKITIFNRKYIFKWWIFHCHVSFREGILQPKRLQVLARPKALTSKTLRVEKRDKNSLKKWRCSLWLGGIPGPVTMESEGLWGALHKNEQIIYIYYFTVSGWGIPPNYGYTWMIGN